MASNKSVSIGMSDEKFRKSGGLNLFCSKYKTNSTGAVLGIFHPIIRKGRIMEQKCAFGRVLEGSERLFGLKMRLISIYYVYKSRMI